MIAALPAGVALYKQTAVFTETSIPAGLLRDHSTKEGTWGLIRIEDGRLLYAVTDPRRPASEAILTSAVAGVVEPTILHHVAPLGPVRFHVEFYRAADPDPVSPA